MKLVDKFFKAYGSTLTFRLVKGFRLQRNFLDLTNFFFFFKICTVSEVLLTNKDSIVLTQVEN